MWNKKYPPTNRSPLLRQQIVGGKFVLQYYLQSITYNQYPLLCDKCLGIGQSFLGNVGSTEHTSYLMEALVGGELLDVGDGLFVCIGLVDAEVLVTFACYLWQVGDGDDLQM